jgi:hypothetical protein
MEAVSPVMPGSESFEIILGKDQPEYKPLSAIYVDSPEMPMITRWRLSNEERTMIVAGADIVLQQLTFHQPFHPVNLQIVFAQDAPVLCELS